MSAQTRGAPFVLHSSPFSGVNNLPSVHVVSLTISTMARHVTGPPPPLPPYPCEYDQCSRVQNTYDPRQMEEWMPTACVAARAGLSIYPLAIRPVSGLSIFFTRLYLSSKRNRTCRGRAFLVRIPAHLPLCHPGPLPSTAPGA